MKWKLLLVFGYMLAGYTAAINSSGGYWYLLVCVGAGIVDIASYMDARVRLSKQWGISNENFR